MRHCNLHNNSRIGGSQGPRLVACLRIGLPQDALDVIQETLQRRRGCARLCCPRRRSHSLQAALRDPARSLKGRK